MTVARLRSLGEFERGPDMSDIGFDLKAADGHQIAVWHWPAAAPKGVVHVLHGMAEHGARYARLADLLNQHDWSVVAHDHRGHGRSVIGERLRGHYADRDGWRKVVNDVTEVQTWIAHQYPGLPRVLMGHSMGSFIALSYAIEHGLELDALVLSGTDMKPNLYYRLMRLVLGLEKARLGPRSHSALVHALTFGAFARKIPDRATEFDWLSRDPDEVRKYIDDPYCGHDCSLQLWCDMLDGLIANSGSKGLPRLSPQLPVFVFAGDQDPMSDFGKGVALLVQRLRALGLEHLRVEIYPGARHETLNDINRDQVMKTLTGWLQSLPSDV